MRFAASSFDIISRWKVQVENGKEVKMSKYVKPGVTTVESKRFVTAEMMCSGHCGNGSNSKVC